ncbi:MULTISPECIES: glycosyltransferase [Pseudomonas]|uniref:glycosyltransferase n=1 Tax=Pseudomonas TaxID=286 RepID=UPI0006CC9853|nr:glycosyltransferase [Pseudomonas fuscovaginae]KPA96675.1 glycosyltransferase [Pseudomonas fuscovaginae]
MSVLVMSFYGAPGGAERRFVRTFRKMQELYGGHRLIINSHGKTALESVGVPLDLNGVVVLNDLRLFGRLGAVSKVAFVFQLWWYVLSQRLRHLHYPVDPSYLTLFHSFVGRALRVRYSLSVVDSSRPDRSNFSRYSWFLWRRSIGFATRLDCLSGGIAKSVERLFGVRPPIEISPCSFTDYSRSFVAEKKDYDIVLMSRLCEGKGLSIFFDALTEIKKSYSDFSVGNIGIFGAGPLHDYVESRIAGLPSFHIELGFASNPFEVLSRAKIFMSLQDKENYPSQSLLEAISCGALVIATDVGETHRIVSDEVGYRVPADAARLADKIVVALTRLRMNQFDWQGAAEMVRREHTVERFSTYFSGFLERAL